MTNPSFAAPPHRATILVGYGAFGLEVLRRLLASTAPRGVLTWEESRGGAGPGERHLQDLALLWFPDPMASSTEQVDPESAREGEALEMMRDLYRQIEPVGDGDGTPTEDDFAKKLSAAADQLLAANTRAGRKTALPLGLDVIVIARPTTREVVGTLDRLLVKGMERLANNTNLERAVQGAEALNFIAILDFEHYWDRSADGRIVRGAVRDSVEQWQKRRVSGYPSFARLYLVDGRTDDGTRPSFLRVDEISLFLEFLLFEGQRSGELPRLYQSAGPHESAIGTFAIRLVERSAGLLAHLAAARFGIGWLEYMAGAGAYRGAVDPVHLQERLEPFAPQTLDALLDGDSLRADVAKELDNLEEELTELGVELPDWPQRVRTRYEGTRRRLADRLSARAQTLMAGIAENHLRQLPAELRAGIEEDLRDAQNPVPVGSVIAELEGALEQLARTEEVVPPAPDRAVRHLREIERLHEDYDRFDRERVEVEELKRWWPLLALALSAGLTPIIHQLIGSVSPPDPLHFLLSRTYAWLQRIGNPFAVGLLIFGALWAIGALILQHGIAGRIDRARRYYNDPQRGRFVDRLRSGMKPGGALREPLDYLVDRLLFDMALSVRGDVTRELGRVVARLNERRREMLWLSEQLRGFLRMHGFAGEELRLDSGRLERDGTGIRVAMERGDDFEAMLRSNPPGQERFRSVQASHSPFEGWDERYSRSFLAPIEFLDRLSRLYRDPFEQELARAGVGPEQRRMAEELLDFIKERGSFGLAFRFNAQVGVPPDQRYCLIPPLWQRLNGVLPALADQRMTDQSVITAENEGRGYLLRFLGGVDPKCLVDQP